MAYRHLTTVQLHAVGVRMPLLCSWLHVLQSFTMPHEPRCPPNSLPTRDAHAPCRWIDLSVFAMNARPDDGRRRPRWAELTLLPLPPVTAQNVTVTNYKGAQGYSCYIASATWRIRTGQSPLLPSCRRRWTRRTRREAFSRTPVPVPAVGAPQIASAVVRWSDLRLRAFNPQQSELVSSLLRFVIRGTTHATRSASSDTLSVSRTLLIRLSCTIQCR